MTDGQKSQKKKKAVCKTAQDLGQKIKFFLWYPKLDFFRSKLRTFFCFVFAAFLGINAIVLELDPGNQKVT